MVNRYGIECETYGICECTSIIIHSRSVKYYWYCIFVKSCFAIKFKLIRYCCTLYALMLLKLMMYIHIVLELSVHTSSYTLYYEVEFILYIVLLGSFSSMRFYYIELYASQSFLQISSTNPFAFLTYSTHISRLIISIY